MIQKAANMNQITNTISKLCQIGKNQGMTMKDISNKANISNSFLSEVANGKKVNISLEKVFNLADAVGAQISINEPDK